MAERVAIILAAGISSRMNTELPKVLHEVCGRPMLGYVLDASREVGIRRIYAVVGHGAELVRKQFSTASDVVWVHQDEQKGTAHAILCCREKLKDFEGQTLVLCGDGPLIRAQTIKTLIEKHQTEQPAATLATAILDSPAGYGRIIRDSNGNIQGIVEHSDCTDEQLGICEVNPSYYLFNNKVLFEALEKVRPDNIKKEYYLTDALSIIIGAGYKVAAVTAVRPEEAMSVNTKTQLDEVNNVMRQRIEDSKLEIQN